MLLSSNVKVQIIQFFTEKNLDLQLFMFNWKGDDNPFVLLYCSTYSSRSRQVSGQRKAVLLAFCRNQDLLVKQLQ